MKLIMVTLTFMVALTIATCLSMTLTVLGIEHQAPHAFIIVMSAFTGLTAFMTVALPCAFYNAHSKQ